MRRLFLLTALFALLVTSSCGYTLQSSKSNELEKIGIHRVYVAPLKNLSYKPGVENTLYNELVQILTAGRRVKIVSKPEEADAKLDGIITTAKYSSSASTSSDQIYPPRSGANSAEPAVTQLIIATEYQAFLECQFKLTKLDSNGGMTSEAWGSAFSRTKRFPGNNQKRQFGTTSALINESEFDRALKEMSHAMMLDVHESMLARF